MISRSHVPPTFVNSLHFLISPLPRLKSMTSTPFTTSPHKIAHTTATLSVLGETCASASEGEETQDSHSSDQDDASQSLPGSTRNELTGPLPLHTASSALPSGDVLRGSPDIQQDHLGSLDFLQHFDASLAEYLRIRGPTVAEVRTLESLWTSTEDDAQLLPALSYDDGRFPGLYIVDGGLDAFYDKFFVQTLKLAILFSISHAPSSMAPLLSCQLSNSNSCYRIRQVSSHYIRWYPSYNMPLKISQP